MRRIILAAILVCLPGLIQSELHCSAGNADCSCTRGVRGDYELLCPKDVYQQPALIGTLLPNRYLQLQCTNMKDWKDIQLVNGLNMGPVPELVLRLCPLPGVSFRELMAAIGINSTVSLHVQSHGNMSNMLTRQHLEGLEEIRTLNLNMNALTELPEDLFQEMGNLTWLDLKNNQLVLPKGIFKPVPRLQVLELGGNNISYLEPGIFRNLTKLRLLNLWGNRLRNLTRSIFSDMPNLENLDLSNNGLETFPPDVFADLGKLRNVNLCCNNFVSLPHNLFRSTTQLEKIQIHSNRRSLKTLPSQFFADLKQLKELNLKNCNISFLPGDLLQGCSGLVNLTLQQNLLTELPEGIFRDIKDATKIILSYNRLAVIPGSTFSTLSTLKILDLSNNELTAISNDLFSNLRELTDLNLSNNKIQVIQPNAFEAAVSLGTLDLTSNYLTNMKKTYSGPFGDDSVLQASIRLEYLYLAHNDLNSFYSDWQVSMINLQVLDLSYNNFTKLSYSEVTQFLSTSLTIDLSDNKITEVSLEGAEELALMKFGDTKSAIPENNSVRVLLKDNPLVCDCRAYDLMRYFRDEIEPVVRLYASFDGAGLECDGPDELKGSLVKSVDPRPLTCEVEDMECPTNCTCHYRPSNSGLVVDCSRRGLVQAPPSLPSENFVRRNINHTELDLRANNLIRLPKRLGQGYSRVTKLYLSYNNLTSINITSFSKDLQVLELNNNNLTRIETPSLKMLSESKALELITLQNNPWICDCQTKEFLTFLHGNFKKIPHMNNITCSSGASISKLTASDLCPFTNLAIGIVSMIIAILGLLVGSSVALYYRYQKEIKVWLYAHRICLWFVTEEELDKDKQYDAFVSYSHQDEKFITEHLQPELENGPTKYKLCLHYRDWVAGEFIPNQIARSVEDSKRTIVVLSPNFLESVWGKMEFRTAHCQALKEGRARVIVILYGDIGPTDKLDPELSAYLSTNTYVKWGDPWFWEKLRYALPHPPELSKGIPLISRQSTRRNGAEKLINGNDPNSTPPAVTTPPADSLIIDPLKTLSNSKPV